VTGWLLDTDVLSVFAPGKRAAAPKVISWCEDRTEELYLSSITAAEIEAGISKARRTAPGRGRMNCRLGLNA
jgi:predicted nucleic acid-binding protein